MNIDNPNHPRYNTNRLMAAIDEGMFSQEYVLNAALSALSDDEVHQMCLANDILLEDNDNG